MVAEMVNPTHLQYFQILAIVMLTISIYLFTTHCILVITNVSKFAFIVYTLFFWGLVALIAVTPPKGRCPL